MGTPRVAIPSLEALVKSGETILAVVTQPDRPAGRKQTLTPPPVKEAAQKFKLTVLQPEKAKDPIFIESIRALYPDVIVVIAYGQLLRPALLEIPRLGCVNIHASLLPKYRGAAPAQWAIINGEKETGVTTMLMDAGLDTGPILKQAVIPIAPDETSATLLDKMSIVGAKVLLDTLEKLKNGTLKAAPQDSRIATMAPILKKEDGLIRWTDSAEQIERRGRALTPWPGMFTYYDNYLLKVLKVKVEEVPPGGTPGEIIAAEKGKFLVATGAKALHLLEVQPENGNRMSADQFLAGHSLKKGEMLGRISS